LGDYLLGSVYSPNKTADKEKERRMTPPEKIYLTAQDIEELLFHEAEGKAYGAGDLETFEYHLAPVWHDAVKEPPKEEGSQLVYWGENTYAWIMFDFEHGWVSEIDPLYWMPLPLPPERSGEIFKKDLGNIEINGRTYHRHHMKGSGE
jgi:hypothetical protein